MNMRSVPWVDKYRPNKLNYIVHQQELMKTLHNILETGEMPHLLFYGPPGTGKTTTILALANELFGPIKFKERVLELNASDERGINVVRNEIITFAKSIIGNPDPKYKCPPFKILILDEADAMTPDAQSALRKIMEEYSTITRFCLICNYVDKIIDPIISRCMPFRFMSISIDVMKERLQFIGKKENIELEDDIYDTIVSVVGGDLRKGIMLLQNIKYISISKKHVEINDVYDLVGYVPKTIIKTFIKECTENDDIDIIEIAQNFYTQGYPVNNLCEQLCNTFVNDEKIDDHLKVKIMHLISDICDKLNDGASEFIQLTKLVVHLNMIFCKK
jgi:replication factor C subunit 2/4